MGKYIMALDQGTTSSRCILFDKKGNMCSVAQKEYKQYYPKPGWVEHDPKEIWSSQISVATEAMSKISVDAEDIHAIGITNQRETTIVWDKKTGEPVFQDELRWHRKKATVIVGVIMILLGTLSSLGYGPLGFVKIIGMQFLDFFDFLTNSVMMPIAALATCLLISRKVGVEKIEEEVVAEGGTFRRKKIFNFMIKYLCPIFAAIILLSSVANAFGLISM